MSKDPIRSDVTELNELIRSAVEQASVGLAVVDGAEVLWANRTYIDLASQAGLTESQLAQRAADASGVLRVATESVRVVSHVSSEPHLIELMPMRVAASEAGAPDQLDDLTRVLRRSALEASLTEWLHGDSERTFAIAFLDLDRFKSVNDQHGHLVGDACLREVGGRLKQAVRQGDLVGRYGGDEFVLLLAGVSQAADAEPIAGRLRDSIGRPIETPAGPVCLGLSLGLACSTTGYPGAEAMLDAADRAMYANKRSLDPPADIAESARLG